MKWFGTIYSPGKLKKEKLGTEISASFVFFLGYAGSS
jgi:hypothetical protein